MNNWQTFTKGFFKENPTFVLLLGMCPTLGVTTSAINGLGMGLATAFVLVLSNLAISLVANLIPEDRKNPDSRFYRDHCCIRYCGRYVYGSLPAELARIVGIIHSVDRGELYRVGTS